MESSCLLGASWIVGCLCMFPYSWVEWKRQCTLYSSWFYCICCNLVLSYISTVSCSRQEASEQSFVFATVHHRTLRKFRTIAPLRVRSKTSFEQFFIFSHSIKSILRSTRRFSKCKNLRLPSVTDVCERLKTMARLGNAMYLWVQHRSTR